ncbi:hypothetical protein PG997_015037 [Apiospora hydei]|uniref:Uncharacterized protein n=1 Tax=Apiospora hydei TaxID=1337664 RepID=A0ABR1UVH6_9PEZI
MSQTRSRRREQWVSLCWDALRVELEQRQQAVFRVAHCLLRVQLRVAEQDVVVANLFGRSTTFVEDAPFVIIPAADILARLAARRIGSIIGTQQVLDGDAEGWTPRSRRALNKRTTLRQVDGDLCGPAKDRRRLCGGRQICTYCHAVREGKIANNTLPGRGLEHNPAVGLDGRGGGADAPFLVTRDAEVHCRDEMGGGISSAMTPATEAVLTWPKGPLLVVSSTTLYRKNITATWCR